MQDTLNSWLLENAQWLSYEFMQNSIKNYLVAILICVAVFVVIKIFRFTILLKLRHLSEKTKNKFDDSFVAVFEKISDFFYFYLSIYIGAKFLTTEELTGKVLDNILFVLAIYEIIKVIVALADFLLRKTHRRQSSTAIQGIKLILKLILWSTGLLLILSNFGFNISALVASMGIGGIAVALAAQNILSDLFSSFTIYFDKPFEVGDYISIGEHGGTVEKIGLKTTRIKTLRGEELVVSNQELTSTRVQNFKKLQRRRIDFTLGVEYETPNAKMKKVVPIVQKIIEETEHIEWFRGHFTTFGDFSLNFDFSYFVNSDDYAIYLEAHNSINLQIKEAFEKEKISMAFPTQTLHLVKS